MVIVAVVLALAVACGSPKPNVSDDRPETAGGRQPDVYDNATKVTLYRNVDGVPNIAIFCAGALRFATTLSGSMQESPSMVRVPEQDAMCRD